MEHDDKLIRQPSAPTPQNTSSDAKDALALLEADHRSVDKLFDAFDRAGDDLAAKSTLVQRACEMLSVHTMLEEELLYPAARKALGKTDEPDVDEAYVEHYLVKTVIEKFATLKPGDQGFDATFKVMKGMVQRHVEEEESMLFPELRKTSLDVKALGRQIAERKAELDGKLDAAGNRSVGDMT